MGKASDGFGFEGQLTAEQRARLVNGVESLPKAVRGGNIKRLADLVEIALESAWPIALSADVEAVEMAATPHINALMKAAKALMPLMPPEELRPGFLAAAEERSWLHRIDHFEGAIARIFVEDEGDDWDAAFKAAAAVRHLVTALGPLTAPKIRRGRKRYRGVGQAVIAAICFYLEEEGLSPPYWWGEDQLRAGDRDKGRQAQAPIPATITAQLIAVVADALGLPEPNHTLKDRLDRYSRYLDKENRRPAMEDFSVEHTLAADGGTG